MKKYVVVTVVPVLVFLAVIWAGQSLTEDLANGASSTAAVAGKASVSVALTGVSSRPAREETRTKSLEPPSPPTLDPPSLVPPALEVPLRAVSPEIALCIPSALERDRGPIDLEVHFTPVAGGAFAPGTTVESSWHDEEIERCVAEVFDETTFWPSGAERFVPSSFVFHFPDDEQIGLLGLRFSPWR